MSPDLTTLDRFFFYFFLPTLIIAILGGHRYYFKRRKPVSKVFKISDDLIFGNFIAIYVALGIAIFLYFYILNIDILKDLKWELLTLIGMVLLSFPIGVGVGAHLVAVSLRKLKPYDSANKKEITKAVDFFHYLFSHNIVYSSILLIIYLLTLLDLFKGRSLELSLLQISLILFSGTVIGGVSAILFIITKSQKLILKPVLIILVSLLVVSIGETRNLIEHPVTLLATVAYSVVALGIIIYRQAGFNLRTPVKRLVKHWLQWDIDYL